MIEWDSIDRAFLLRSMSFVCTLLHYGCYINGCYITDILYYY